MALDTDMPREFTTMRSGDTWTRPTSREIVLRKKLDSAKARQLLARVADTQWSELHHAYGPATDVPGQLAAVIVGDDETRDNAWWNLRGNIHHQGTIYDATVPAVPTLFDLADWREHPDRAEALLMLREIGAAEGVSVWRYDDNNDLVHNEDEQRRLYPPLRATLNKGATKLIAGWRSEPDAIRRRLLWLLSVLPDLREPYAALITELLPARHRTAWEMELAGSVASQEDADAVFALRDWVYGEAEA